MLFIGLMSSRVHMKYQLLVLMELKPLFGNYLECLRNFVLEDNNILSLVLLPEDKHFIEY